MPTDNATILNNVISISANGANTGVTFFQKHNFTVLQDAYAIRWKYDDTKLTDNQYLFLVGSINKRIFGNYEWTNKAGWERIKHDKILLPLNRFERINFDFMENFIAELEAQRIAELEAYLKVTGLDDYELNNEEVRVLNEFNSNDIELDLFKFREIFNNIEQGRRLKKSDQREGTLPFVMSGVTNTGIVGYISNPIASFPKNSITVDIFGNTFYRNYNFGAGDDTGVYWSDNIAYSQETMLYFTAAMNKALAGKFSYGYKLRSSQSFDFEMILPSKNHVPDFRKINILISAIKKLVIKDVIIYADNKISATKKCIHN